MRLLIFCFSICCLIACQESSDSTSSTQEVTENTETVDATTQGDFPSRLKNGLLVYHSLIGITDTIGGDRVRYMCDMVTYNLNKKFVFVDKDNELFVTDNPDTINAANLHQHVPYVMKMHAYTGAVSDNGQNVQIVNLGFNYNEATQVGRAKAADRPEFYNWKDRPNLKASSIPACEDRTKLECRAQQLVRTVAKQSLN